MKYCIGCETHLGEELPRFYVLLCVRACARARVCLGLDNGQLLAKEVLTKHLKFSVNICHDMNKIYHSEKGPCFQKSLMCGIGSKSSIN